MQSNNIKVNEWWCNGLYQYFRIASKLTNINDSVLSACNRRTLMHSLLMHEISVLKVLFVIWKFYLCCYDISAVNKKSLKQS